MKSGSLNLLEPSGPHRACYGTPLLLFHADVRDFSLFQNVESGSVIQMGTGDPQGVKRPGRDPDISPSPSAYEGTIPLLSLYAFIAFKVQLHLPFSRKFRAVIAVGDQLNGNSLCDNVTSLLHT